MSTGMQAGIRYLREIPFLWLPAWYVCAWIWESTISADIPEPPASECLPCLDISSVFP